MMSSKTIEKSALIMLYVLCSCSCTKCSSFAVCLDDGSLNSAENTQVVGNNFFQFLTLVIEIYIS